MLGPVVSWAHCPLNARHDCCLTTLPVTSALGFGGAGCWAGPLCTRLTPALLPLPVFLFQVPPIEENFLDDNKHLLKPWDTKKVGVGVLGRDCAALGGVQGGCPSGFLVLVRGMWRWEGSPWGGAGPVRWGGRSRGGEWGHAAPSARTVHLGWCCGCLPLAPGVLQCVFTSLLARNCRPPLLVGGAG